MADYIRLYGIFLLLSIIVSGCGFVPPGTAQLENNENTYLDKEPITNLGWKEYLYWIKNDSSVKYSTALPDSSAWLKAYPDSGFLSDTYNDAPVVGITYEQAKDYCEWRSTPVNQKYDKQVSYRLPDLETLKEVNDLKEFNMKEGDLKELIAPGSVVELGEKLNKSKYEGPRTNLVFRCVANIKN